MWVRPISPSLTRPAPALIVSAIFAFDVEAFGADLIVDLVAAVHLDVGVHNGHHLMVEGDNEGGGKHKN